MNVTLNPYSQASNLFLPKPLMLKVFSILEKIDFFHVMFVCKAWKECALKSQKYLIYKPQEVSQSAEGINWKQHSKFQFFYLPEARMGQKADDKCEPYVEDFLKETADKYLQTNRLTNYAINSPNGSLAKLGECSCMNAERFSFQKERALFEKMALEGLIKVFRANSNEKIEITFVASGYLFGEFIILTKFLHRIQSDPTVPSNVVITINILDKIYEKFLEKEDIKLAIETFEREIRLNMPSSFLLTLRVFDCHDDYRKFYKVHLSFRTDCLITIEPAEADLDFWETMYNGMKKFSFTARLAAIGGGVLNATGTITRVMENEQKQILFVRKTNDVEFKNHQINKIERYIDFNFTFKKLNRRISNFLSFIEFGDYPLFNRLKQTYENQFKKEPFEKFEIAREDLG